MYMEKKVENRSIFQLAAALPVTTGFVNIREFSINIYKIEKNGTIIYFPLTLRGCCSTTTRMQQREMFSVNEARNDAARWVVALLQQDNNSAFGCMLYCIAFSLEMQCNTTRNACNATIHTD